MSDPGPQAGRLPPGYEFVRLLGHGATGWVALARQVQLDRLVAVKTIQADVRDPDAAARLQREGKAIAALRHPHVVWVYDLLISPTTVSLVMEHVPGGDLRHAIDGGRLSGPAAVQVLCDIAAALGHAHDRGIVHRDVKPANVLLGPDGRAKLADFGLARLPRSTQEFRTLAGQAIGTPLYMAPEQIEQPDVESASIDAYAFAVLAYEVLTGSLPYAASEFAAVIHAHLYASPSSPWAVAPGLPTPVGEALLAGLAKRPAERATPALLADRLRAVTPSDWDGFFRGRSSAPPPRTGGVGATEAGETEAGGAGSPPGRGDAARAGRPLVPADPATWPGPDVWVQPPVYRLQQAPRFRAVSLARAVGVLVGLVAGVVAVLIVLHR
jgi:serine/threonine-protein kinase